MAVASVLSVSFFQNSTRSEVHKFISVKCWEKSVSFSKLKQDIHKVPGADLGGGDGYAPPPSGIPPTHQPKGPPFGIILCHPF